MSTVGAAKSQKTSPRRRRLIDTSAVVWIVRLLAFVAVLAVWEWYGGEVNPALFAPVSSVVVSLVDLIFSDARIPQAFIETNVSLAVGLGLAISIGVPVGLMMGRWLTLRQLLSPYVSFLYTIPRIALIPVLILWFGIGAELRIAIVFLASVFPIIINTLVGVGEIGEDLSDVARVACASPGQEMRTLVLPGTIPFIFTGVQNGLANALVAAIAAEMVAVLTGLGGLVREYANFFQTANMIAPILIIALESVVLFALMKWLRRRFAPWSTS